MAGTPELVTAAEFDAMTPDERAQVVREHIVTDSEQLPLAFRRRLHATTARLVEQLDPAVE